MGSNACEQREDRLQNEKFPFYLNNQEQPVSFGMFVAGRFDLMTVELAQHVRMCKLLRGGPLREQPTNYKI